jgi:lipid A 3-O-deacylase
MTRYATGLGAVLLVLLASLAPAAAYDPKEAFMQGSLVISPEFSYGHQFNFEDKRDYTGVEFVNGGVRFGWLPFAPLAEKTPFYGAFEIGFEPLYQQYLDPDLVYFAGLGLTTRYHFLSLGRFVPYLDAAGFAGRTNLKITEIRSSFTFLVWAGLGASYFVTDRTAVYTGYRWQHVSNGNTSEPNRGFESHTGVVGVSFFFE